MNTMEIFIHLLLHRDYRVAIVNVVVKLIIAVRGCELIYRLKNYQHI